MIANKMRPTTCFGNRIKLLAMFGLLQLALLSTNNNNNHGLVHCSSSYIDDYFLPTAKIALNKLQQSLTTTNNNNAVQEAAGVAKPLPNTSIESATGHKATSFDQTEAVALDATLSSVSEERQTLSSVDLESSSEPNKNEFVNLNVRPDGSDTELRVLDVSPQPKASTSSSNDEEEDNSSRARVISSTESSSVDPITFGADSETEQPPADNSAQAVTNDNSEPGREAGSVAVASEAAASPENPTTSTTTTATTTTAGQPSTSSPGSDDDRQPQEPVVVGDTISNQITKSADEAIRETELEAIAAVDASIGFGDTFSTTSDACYDEYGNARYCEPEFENVAFERQVEVSSECGHPPSRFCTTNLNERNDQIRNCHICDAQHPKKRHPATYLTDLNNQNAPTCWVSAPISTTVGFSNNLTNADSSSSSALQQQQQQQRDNVTLTINLDKRYEITYISMQFCSLKPDSLSIWKSADFGKSWSPYQFYSSQCARLYEKPAANDGARLNGDTGQVEAVCLNSTSSQLGVSGAANGRVAFSTSLDDGASNQLGKSQGSQGHQPSGGVDKTPGLQDWMTASNIRIVLDRHQASWIQSSLAHSHHHQSQRLGASGFSNALNNMSLGQQLASQPLIGPNRLGADSSAGKPQQAALSMQASPMATTATTTTTTTNQGQSAAPNSELEASLTNPSDTYNYALSDLTIGGRCKCNGHASRCVHNSDGRLQCDCQHNTDGPDCERCLPLHHDRPWQRATQANANPCQPCNCNGHSRKCRFDSELYLLSGKRSGGVCIDCKDNTTGRHCNYCKEGFTRDHTKPMSDQGACKQCDCHPVGSLGKVCNHLTGQCPCKEGVTGLECNRCAPGYQQSSSPTEPCIRLPENDINYEPIIEATGSSSAEDDQQQQQTSSVSHQASNDQELGLDGGEPVPVTGVRAQSGLDTPTKPQQPSAPKQLGPTDNNRIDLVISSDEGQLGSAGYEQPLGGAEFDGNGLRQLPAHRLRHKPGHRQWQGYQQPASTRRGDYLSAAGGKQRARPHQFVAHQSDDLDELDMMRTGQQQPPQRAVQLQDDQDDYEGGRSTSWRKTYYHANKQRVGGGGGGGNYADFRQPSMRTIANLDHDGQADGGDQFAGGQDERAGVGGYGSQDVAGAIYGQPSAMDDASFNHIMRPRLHNPNLAQTRYHSHRQQQQQQRHRLLPANDRNQKHFGQAPTSNSLNCAGCQARTKKLNSKQFCHLDYAIRATVISKQASSDWTRFEVEIQDIFKSPSSSSLLQAQGTGAANTANLLTSATAGAEPLQKSSNYLMSSESLPAGLVQSDDPTVLPSQLGAATQNQTQQSQQQLAAAEQAANVIPNGEHPIHRLRIGSSQSIWVPTEDVACKCPRLKLRSSYLLMGLVDTHKSSAASIQLDRHGVSMVWRPSLQEKLIKYQRLHSDGLCWRAAAAAAA